MLIQAELKKFCSSTGDELIGHLADLDNCFRVVVESTSTVGTLAKFNMKLQGMVGQQLFQTFGTYGNFMS
jgi:hypothetical protein